VNDKPTVGALIASRYTLGRELGRGGMGSVWEAHDETLDRPVAVKTLLADAGVALERFEREARAVAKLRSPHIVEVHDFGVTPFPFMVMELLQGEDLGQRLRLEKTLSLRETSRVITQICRALATAHGAGIIHRDLKPGNVFLTHAHGEDWVKVVDFGVAKVTSGPQRGRKLTTRGALLGTPSHMSPESLQGGDIDLRSDLWAVSVIAYRCLTGSRPFVTEDFVALIETLLSGAPPPPVSLHDATLPKVLDAFFAKGLAKEPDDRYQSAEELALALQDIAGASVAAPSDATGPQLPPPGAASSHEAAHESRATHETMTTQRVASMREPATSRDETTLLREPDPTSPTLHRQGGWTGSEPARRTQAQRWLLIAAALVVTVGALGFGLLGNDDGAADPAGSSLQSASDQPPANDSTTTPPGAPPEAEPPEIEPPEIEPSAIASGVASASAAGASASAAPRADKPPPAVASGRPRPPITHAQPPPPPKTPVRKGTFDTLY
jgi:serine/threonine-protein kinase